MSKKQKPPRLPDPAVFAFGVIQHISGDRPQPVKPIKKKVKNTRAKKS